MRAREPDTEGFIERDGVKVFFEAFGDASRPAILLMPTWPIVHSRMWKGQVPFLARHFRVLTFDPRGNGRSDRPRDPNAYTDDEYVQDAIQVMDETGTEAAVLVGLCPGVRWSIEAAVAHPDRVLGVVALAPGIPFLTPGLPHRAAAIATFDQEVDEGAGWAAKENRHYWLRDYPGWVRYHSGDVFMLPEPHSTKVYEDLVGWGLETDAETLLITHEAPGGDLFPPTKEAAEDLCRRVRCPMLIVHGSDDRCQPLSRAERLAELTGGRLVVLEGAGHAPMGRHPVVVNLLIKEFVDQVAPAVGPPPARRWTAEGSRPKRALFLSSPIGLGHALRDLAIAEELRTLRPDLQIEWLTQHPVTAVLAARGERVHPACEALANETAHIEGEAAEHDLRVFQAFRDMDEILLANFHVFHELVSEEPYDLVIGDESWDVDHFLHENPELKRAPFAWLTDFVGWLPMPEGGEHEAFVASDYNAEMLEHVERHPTLRDRSVFVGNPDDIVPDAFGADLPSIREWTEAHYGFAGYVLPFDPAGLSHEAAREALGYGPDEKVCLVTVGGSGVGEPLLRRVLQAHRHAAALVPGLRMVVVTGPRIDPASLDAPDGVEVHGFVDGLRRHMAACDVAVVQGGLSTTMELTALGRPFLYFPLRGHFEQNRHVRHRLERYGAGRRMDYGRADAEAVGAAIAEELVTPSKSLPVETDGAARAAAMIAELV